MVGRNSSIPNIVTEGVQVRYQVRTDAPKKTGTGIAKLASSAVGVRKKTTVRALRGVNFVASEGEMVGIVGTNGSGKSTLLRNIAGVEQPDRGRILVRYQPLLLGVSAALQPSLSGSANIRLGCLAMGLTPEEAENAYDRVIELSALGPAIHRPMGTYSSGMGSRLRFAIALAARPKILLIDEALSTGDATFEERSQNAMNSLLKDAGTVLLVNHAAKVIQDLCSRAVWMHRGEIIMNGPAEAVAEKYRWWAWNVAKGQTEVSDKLLHDVVSNAVKEEIDVLEPEMVRNPIPRHANRIRRKKTPGSRHKRNQINTNDASKQSPSEISTRQARPWPKEFDNKLPRAEFPALPKPATDAGSAQKARMKQPPIRRRSSNDTVVLRAANPADRASSYAVEMDFTERRITSSKRGKAEHVPSGRPDDSDPNKIQKVDGEPSS